jgi:hypothetical protein
MSKTNHVFDLIFGGFKLLTNCFEPKQTSTWQSTGNQTTAFQVVPAAQALPAGSKQ